MSFFVAPGLATQNCNFLFLDVLDPRSGCKKAQPEADGQPGAVFFVKETFGLCPRFGFAIIDPIGNNKANVGRINI